MKALSVRQPAANKIASGEKTIELRTWATKYRGPVLIVSSKKPKIEPAGCVLAIVDIVDCQPMREEHMAASCCSQVYPECFSWILANVRQIRPFALRGSLGLYEVNLDQSNIDAEDRQQIELCIGEKIGNLALDFDD